MHPFGVDGTEVGLCEHLFLCLLPVWDDVLANYLANIIAVAVGLSRLNYMIQVLLVFPFVLRLSYPGDEVLVFLYIWHPFGTARLLLNHLDWVWSFICWWTCLLSLFAWIWRTCQVTVIPSTRVLVVELSLMLHSWWYRALGIVGANSGTRARTAREGVPLILERSLCLSGTLGGELGRRC